MRTAYLMILCGFLLSCTPEKPEVLDYDDIATGSDRYPEGQEPETNDSEEDSLAWLRNELAAAGISTEKIEIWNDRLFPDRFGAERADKFIFASGQDTLRFVTWKYSDSGRVMNTVYNWIDCFGPKCKSVFVGENKNMQRNPFQLLISDTTLVYVEGNVAVNTKNWEKLLEARGYEKNWNLIIEQGKGGNARWFTYEEEKKIPYKK